MLETFMYLTAAVVVVVLVAWATPRDRPLRTTILGVGLLFVVLTTAPHDPQATTTLLGTIVSLITE